MNKSFFAMINRMNLINRWGLMRNTRVENISEHSHQVAIIAHALAVIGNKKFSKSYNAERACLLAAYHDATEIITGDMPTPVKYFNATIVSAYKDVERVAGQRLLAMLPQEFQEDYNSLLFKEDNDKSLWALVKAADTLSAYIKCIEECKAGNSEFSIAIKTLEDKVNAIELDEVKYFVENFLPSYSMTLDEHTK